MRIIFSIILFIHILLYFYKFFFEFRQFSIPLSASLKKPWLKVAQAPVRFTVWKSTQSLAFTHTIQNHVHTNKCMTV